MATQTNTHIITLTVDTDNIQKPDIDKYCTFGQSSSIPNEDYTVVVNVGDHIIWRGVPKHGKTSSVVNITSINYEGGNNIFGRNTIRGNGQTPETVHATVMSGTAGEEETYEINFTVFNNGKQRNGRFQIDPKIQVH